MSVYIKFEPGKGSGLVADGTNLWDAAKRLGVSIPAECGGRGECDTCAVLINDGANLLSSPTTAELELLGKERLDADQRLACQTRVERSGELVLSLVPPTVHEKTVNEVAEEFRKEFRELPLGRKLKALVEFEAVTAFETLTSLAGLPFTVGEKVMDRVADYGRKINKRESDLNARGEQNPNAKTEGPPVEDPHTKSSKS